MVEVTVILASSAAMKKTEEEVAETTGLQEKVTEMVTGLTAGKLITNWQQEPRIWSLTRASLQQLLSHRLPSSGLL